MKSPLLLLALLIFISSPGWTTRLRPNDYQGGRSRDVEAGAERNTSALAAMLGGFRTSMSDLLYIKTERYLHSGVAYAPHLEGDTLSTAGVISEIDERHASASTKDRRVVEQREAGEAPVKTLVPRQQDDFRGFVGRLEREVKPWVDPSEPHLLTDGREMLPWFRVMTMSDPHYIRGYSVGGWWLQRRNLEAAIRFVGEGVTNNPSSFEVLYTMGQLRLAQGMKANNGSMLVERSESRPHFLAARDCFVRAAELAMAQRPAGWSASATNNPPGWTDYKEDDAQGASRLAALSEQHYGDPLRAADLAVRYQACFGSNAVLERIARGEIAQ